MCCVDCRPNTVLQTDCCTLPVPYSVRCMKIQGKHCYGTQNVCLYSTKSFDDYVTRVVFVSDGSCNVAFGRFLRRWLYLGRRAESHRCCFSPVTVLRRTMAAPRPAPPRTCRTMPRPQAAAGEAASEALLSFGPSQIRLHCKSVFCWCVCVQW